ncbi:Lrp/AsnC family leucine-responsive transcriptional regulator [Bradyrhizobium sp. USDA 3686]|uniref:Lrp/AsnC family transcriptional regulator n=1 Tax=Bradyrhizobium canariense TaxID=255045 RepID=UPI001956B872|nr:Lrp/AsnC family transcriptional regulator [Bradyrhizobium canariense]MBM7487887.1 Lrp/AsnC family leucine-responsive transcriptional regulator [Bradyrhizobium canariense]
MAGQLHGQLDNWTRLSRSDGRSSGTELDSIDARLLDIVQRNNRLSSEELGAGVGLSASAVQRRLKRLRSEGVIEADVSVIFPKAIGRNVTALVLITFERGRADIVDRFKQAMRKMTDVMSAFYVTGQADFVLLVTADNLEDYEGLTRRLVSEHPDIKRFETLIVLDRVKAGFTLPIASTLRARTGD